MFKKNFGFGKHMDNCCRPEQNCPIMEPVINNCIEREFCHEVNHVCPIHTHIINKHIYNHTYTPVYSFSEVDEVENIYQNRCCK